MFIVDSVPTKIVTARIPTKAQIHISCQRTEPVSWRRYNLMLWTSLPVIFLQAQRRWSRSGGYPFRYSLNEPLNLFEGGLAGFSASAYLGKAGGSGLPPAFVFFEGDDSQAVDNAAGAIQVPWTACATVAAGTGAPSLHPKGAIWVVLACPRLPQFFWGS